MKRIATAILGGTCIVGSLWLGLFWFWSVMVLVALAAQYELFQMLRLRSQPVDLVFSMVAGFCIMLHVVWPYWYAALGVTVLLFVLFLEKGGSERRPMERAANLMLSLAWPVAGLSFLPAVYRLLVHGSQSAFFVMLLLLALVWASDIGAYYTGRTLGRHKLAPRISPGKTWEGAVGGFVAALLLAWGAVASGMVDLSLTHALAFGVIAATIGPVGDLLESVFKRSVNVKDSGTLLPGHGGFLDRFDAFILVAPAYWIYWNVMNILP